MSEAGDATEVEHPFSSDTLVNMSLWESVEALHTYVYKTAHNRVMARRKEWFARMREAYTVLWWVPEGHRPTVYEAERKLTLLRANGPTSAAFTFKQVFSAPGTTTSDERPTSSFDDACPAL